MALADPQSVTINAVANTLPRTSSGVNQGQFTKDDGNVQLTVSHSFGKRSRRVVRLQHRKVAPDPLMPASNVPYQMHCYLVIDTPPVGYTAAEAKQIVDALTGYLTASSGARVTQILGGES